MAPGLINAHHHFYQTLTRAHPAGFGKELIPWLVTMERRWDRMTPEALRIAVRMALVELMLSGCTTAADHHNLFPPGLENAIDIEVEEATKLGLRMTVTRGSMGISENNGGLQPDSIVQDLETILEDSERVLGRYHDPKPGAMIRVARFGTASGEQGASGTRIIAPAWVVIAAEHPLAVFKDRLQILHDRVRLQASVLLGNAHRTAGDRHPQAELRRLFDFDVDRVLEAGGKRL